MDTLNIKGVKILRGGRVGFALFFLSIQITKKESKLLSVGTSTRFVWDGIGILENECGHFGQNER